MNHDSSYQENRQKKNLNSKPGISVAACRENVDGSVDHSVKYGTKIGDHERTKDIYRKKLLWI